MKKFLSYIKSSLDTHTNGASARKICAFSFVMATIIVEMSHVDITNLFEIVSANLMFVAVCLGLTTYEYINKKSDSTSDNNPS